MNRLAVLCLFLVFSQGYSVHLSIPSFQSSLLWPRWDPFDDFFTWPSLPGLRRRQCHSDVVTVPVFTRIAQDDKEVSLRLHVPGFKRENIQLKSYDNELRVSGERACNEDERCNKKVFHRNLLLPHNTDFSSAKSYVSGDGWLVVKLQKMQPVERTIDIVEQNQQIDVERPGDQCEGCSDRPDNITVRSYEDDATVEVDESSQPLCSQTSKSDDLYDIGV